MVVWEACNLVRRYTPPSVPSQLMCSEERRKKKKDVLTEQRSQSGGLLKQELVLGRNLIKRSTKITMMDTVQTQENWRLSDVEKIIQGKNTLKLQK